MKEIDYILAKLRAHFNVAKDSDLLELLDIPKGTMDTWKNRDSIPLPRLKEFSSVTGIPLHVLLDQGAIIQTATGDGITQINGNSNNVSNGYGADKIKHRTGTTEQLDDEKVREDMKKAWSMLEIPYYDNIKSSAGFGAVNGRIEKPEMFTLPKNLLPSASKETEAIRCTGDSMSPSLQDGDIMFIDRANTDLHDGEIYVVRVEDELYVKRLVRVPGKIIAKSDNNSYPDFELSGDNFEILGRVIYRMERV